MVYVPAELKIKARPIDTDSGLNNGNKIRRRRPHNMKEIVKEVHHYQEASADGNTLVFWIIEKNTGIYEVLRVESDDSRTALPQEEGNEIVNRFLNQQI